MKPIALIAVLLCAGCVTSSSTSRQIARQIKYLDALSTVQIATEDKLKELGEQIAKGKRDLEALQVQRTIEQAPK